MHYTRWYRNGDPGEASPRLSPPTECSVAGCLQRAKSKGMCHKHFTRWSRHGDPAVVLTPEGRGGAENPAWKGHEIGYGQAHARVRKVRGPAVARNCCRCGGAARHWAYDHDDPKEKVDPKFGPYSTDPAHYEPMCVSCHKKSDLERGGGEHDRPRQADRT